MYTALATDSSSPTQSKEQMINKPFVEGLALPGSSTSRRLNSTCTSSAENNNKSGNGKSKKSLLCSAEKGIQDTEGLSSPIPRPGSAALCRSEMNTRSILERRNGRIKMTSDSNSESHRYAQEAVHNYGQGSLGRRSTNHSLSRGETGTIPNSHSGFSRSSQPQHSKNSGGSNNCTYAYIDTIPHCGSPYSWLSRSPSSLNSSGTVCRSGRIGIGGSLTETESMESLISNCSSSISSQIQHARANSLTQTCLALHQRNLTNSNANTIVNSHSTSSRMTRSNSIRSTKSEKLYPSMLRSHTDDPDDLLEHSGKTLLVDEHRRSCRRSGIIGNGFSYPLSLLNGDGSHLTGSSTSHMACKSNTAVSPFVTGKLYKDDEVHGSQLSLASVASSLHSSPEEKHNHEIRQLRCQLADAHNKVHTLTHQLNTNGSWSMPMDHTAGSGSSALCSQHELTSCGPPGSQDWQAHVVAAFEQSLANMTSRLQTLTQTAERKDSELNELRGIIESLKKENSDAGLVPVNYTISLPASPSRNERHRSGQRHHRRFSTDESESGSEKHWSMNRQLSTDSMSSVNSMSSTCSTSSHPSSDTCSSSVKKEKKIGWLRSSFSKAFSKSKKNRHGSVSDIEDSQGHMLSDTFAPNSPLLSCPPKETLHKPTSSSLKSSHSSSLLKDMKGDDLKSPEVVTELRKQLREKEMVLTDVRLEALSSAHQLELLKETINCMRSEMLSMKHDNERLQQLVSTKSLTSSQTSLLTMDPEKCETPLQKNRFSTSDLSVPLQIDFTGPTEDGIRVVMSVIVGQSGREDDTKVIESSNDEKLNSSSNEVVIGAMYVSGTTRWEALDVLVRKMFNDYVQRVDPAHNLGLNSDSVNSYSVGEIFVNKEFVKPELLPCGYLVGDNMSIKLILKGPEQNSVDSLAFDALIPKLNAQRLVSLLYEHRRIILCGPSGTGKTFLAQKLAEFLVLRSGKALLAGSVATFQVDHQSAKELRQYLSNVAEQCEGSNATVLPSVIILDNLHHVGSLGEVFNGFLSAKYHKCPYIIGTMNHGTCSTTNLQLHHNFRWVLCATHMEPVIGFLGRYLRRKLTEAEVRSNVKNPDLIKIIDWIPVVWQKLNKFLETHSSSDVTIGHRLFLSCPIDVAASQVWFTDLWNYSMVPYLLEAVREGLQLYGRRTAWEDPAEWVIKSFPWPSSGSSEPSLLRLRPEDVGYEGHPGPGGSMTKSSGSVTNELEEDHLLNMLMRLQEATSYSIPQSNDSDNLDSHESISVHTEDASSIILSAGSNRLESTL